MVGESADARISLTDGFFLVCVKECRKAGHSPGLELPSGDLDWDRFLRLAIRHGVSGLILKRWETDISILPPNVAAALENEARAAAARNLLLLSQTGQIMDFLTARGVRTLAYKGPVLSKLLYADVGLRPSTDIDLLVERKDAGAACRLLIELGGVPATHGLSPKREAAYLHAQHHWQFTFPDRPWRDTAVELHWDLVPAYFTLRTRSELLWTDAIKIEHGPFRIETFSPENLLLALSLHGALHLWSRSIWILDIAQLLLVTERLDWGELSGRAEEMGAGRLLLLALRLAEELAGAAIPSVPNSREGGTELSGLIAKVKQWQLDEGFNAFQGAHRFLFLGALLQGRLARLRLFKRYMGVLARPSEADWRACDLPDSLFSLYYPLRLLRLAANRGSQRLQERP